MNNIKKLYKLTNNIGNWWVVAEHPTEAENKLSELLNIADYGHFLDREITNIELIATQYNDITNLTNHKLVV